jgi:iron complex outermembrane receptor protein
MRRLLWMLVLILPTAAGASFNDIDLKGRVTDGSNPVAGVYIRLLNTRWAAVGDSSGRFKMAHVEKGKYWISFQSDGYADQLRQIEIGDENMELTVTLKTTSGFLENVVVSSKRIQQPLSQFAGSITALNKREIRERSISHVTDLTGESTNVYVSQPGDDRPVVSVRGITSSSYHPAVALYVDGVNQFSLDTYLADLGNAQTIEILKGPQGMTYGRGAMGGVINVTTAGAVQRPEFTGELAADNFQTLRTRLSLAALPITPRLQLSLAAGYSTTNGYHRNDFDSTDFDRSVRGSAEGRLTYRIETGLSVTVLSKWQRLTNKGAFPLVFGADKALAAPYRLTQNAKAKMTDDIQNHSLVIQQVGSRLNWTLQEAWQSDYRRYDQPLDADFSGLDMLSIRNDFGREWNRPRVFTHEFRVSGSGRTNKRWELSGGNYFFREINPVRQTTLYGSMAHLLGAVKNSSSELRSKQSATGAAVFAEAKARPAPRWQITAAIRYDWERRKGSVYGQFFAQGMSQPATTRNDTSATAVFHALSPGLTVSFAPDSLTNLYASYSKGFRAGGFTQLSDDPSSPPLYVYEPEVSLSFETGGNITVPNRAFTMKWALFHTRLLRAQLPKLLLPQAVTVTGNAGSMTARGAEMEMEKKLGGSLLVRAAYGFTDTRFTDSYTYGGGTNKNISGNRQIFTPSYTMNLAVEWRRQLRGSGIFLRPEYKSTGKTYFDLDNTIAQSAYGLLQLTAGIHCGPYRVHLWAKNLLNKKYISYAYDFGAVHLGAPLNFGISLIYTKKML